MTVAEFLAWNPPSAQLWQLVDGEPQELALANRTHGSLLAEIGSLIGNHLAERSSSCSVVTAPGVIPRVLSETNFRIPDLAVTCSGYDTEESALTDPVVVIEILSPNNQAETWANVGPTLRSPPFGRSLSSRRSRSAPSFSAATRTAPGQGSLCPSRPAT
jgi:Uma2 family endonuclease